MLQHSKLPIPHFQPIRDADIEQVIALWRACDLTRPWNDPASDIALARHRDNSDILVATDGGGVAATVMVGHEGHRAWIYYLAVDPARRGEGLGRAAMEAAEDWARAMGMPKIQLMIRQENLGAMAFYERLGYGSDTVKLMYKWIDKKAGALYASQN